MIGNTNLSHFSGLCSCCENQTEKKSQYIGLNSYNESQKDIFWGRDDEKERITSSIYTNVSTLLFGPSGSGKTSLMNAGVIPILRDSQYIPIRVTPKDCFTKENKFNLWNNFSEKITQTIAINNIKHTSSVDLSTLSLIDKLYNVAYEDEYGFNVYFLFIIDQFEEIFQLGLNLKEIHEIFDLYEKLCGYSQNNNNNVSHINVTRESFCHRFVLIVRQDYMFELESNAYRFPLLYQNRICVNQLNEEQAYKIITSSKNEDGTDLFSKEQAIDIIRYITNNKYNCFQIDDIPEIEVDSMMLSLYLYETCSYIGKENQEINHLKSYDVIREYYMRNMDIKGVESIEKQLISSDGRHRKPVLYSDCKRLIGDNVNILIKSGIWDLYLQNGVEWIRLRHDKLCQYASEHIQATHTRMSVVRRSRPTKFLSPYLRLSHNNSYISIIKENPDNYNFSQLLYFFLNKHIDNTKFGFEDNIEINRANYSIDIKSYDKYGNLQSDIDGTDTLSVSYTNGKLYNISFFKNKKPHALYFGVHKINFYYDSNSNPILYDFFDISENRIVIEDGYSSMLFVYDETESMQPCKTYYLKVPVNINIIEEFGSPKKKEFVQHALKYKTMHVDGNYGYYSIYKNCCEIERVYLGLDDRETVITEGYSRIIMEKDVNDTLLSISFYQNEQIGYINKQIHKITFEYDTTKTVLLKINYYDEHDNKCPDEEGSYGFINNVTETGLIYQLKTNAMGKCETNKHGIIAQCIAYNNKYQLEWISNIADKDKTSNIPNNDNESCLMFYNECNKIEWSFDFDKDNHIKSFIHLTYDQNSRIIIIRNYDECANNIKTHFLERKENVESIKTFDIYGDLIPNEESFERNKIAANSYVLEQEDGKKIIEVKDAQGNTIVMYYCDDDYNQIEGENKIWEHHYEYQGSTCIKEYILLKDNTLYEIEHNVYGYEYENTDDAKKIYFIDENGKRNIKCVKVETKSLMPEVNDFSYIDETSMTPVNFFDTNVSSLISEELDDNIVVQKYCDCKGKICNGIEGWAIKELYYGKHLKYYDAEGNPVKGPEGWHGWLTPEVIPGMEKASIYIDEKEELINNEYGIAAFYTKKVGIAKRIRLCLKNKTCKFLSFAPLYESNFYNNKLEVIENEYFKSHLYLSSKKLCQELVYELDSKTSIVKLIDIKMGKFSVSSEKKKHSCIIVKQGIDNYYGIKEGDIIVQFDKWCAFNYFNINDKQSSNESRDNLVNEFKEYFNKSQASSCETLFVFARIENLKWRIRKVKVKLSPNKATIGRIMDADITIEDYKKIYNQYKKMEAEDNSVNEILQSAITKAQELTILQNRELDYILTQYR